MKNGEMPEIEGRVIRDAPLPIGLFDDECDVTGRVA
jgi:hypothetical protein